MLGKLIKYDLRSCLRRFWVLWAALVALGVINGFTIRYVLNGDAVKGVWMFFLGILPLILIFGLVATIAVLALVYICERFYRGLLGDEGYLMFTLPATTAEHIASKAIVALILEIISGLVALLAMFLVAVVCVPEETMEILRQIPEALRGLDLPRGVGWLVAETVLLGLVTTVVSTLQIYLAIALGHLAKKHRGGMALLAYVGINIALSIVLTAVGGVGESAIDSLDRFFFYLDSTGFHGSVGPIAAGLGVVLLWTLIKGAGFFFGTKAILDRRLNLE